MKTYSKPKSAIDAATGDLVIRVPAATIALLTERWHRENSGEHAHIRIIDLDGLTDAVSKNIHSHGEDWFPGDMTAVESWIGGSGCQAVLEDDALFDVIPMAQVVHPRMVFFGEWSGRHKTQILDDFDIGVEELIGVEFVVATYEVTKTTGAASVIFKRGGKHYMVIAANRDDKGIEGQWRPLEISVENLRGHFLHPEDESSEAFLASLKAYLEELEACERKADYDHMLESVKAAEDEERAAYLAR